MGPTVNTGETAMGWRDDDGGREKGNEKVGWILNLSELTDFIMFEQPRRRRRARSIYLCAALAKEQVEEYYSLRCPWSPCRGSFSRGMYSRG